VYQSRLSIQRRKWRGIGQPLRKPITTITRQSFEWNPKGTQRKGKPKTSRRRTMQKEYKDIGTSWNEVKRTTEKSSPQETCSGGPMLRSERRGISQVSQVKMAIWKPCICLTTALISGRYMKGRFMVHEGA